MLFGKKKIPCYVLVFDQVAIIKRTLDFLTQYADRLDIVVIENPSPSTPEIKKIVERLGKTGIVARYYLLDKNITSGAYTVAVNNEIEAIKKSPFVVITDGDVIVEHGDWLKEEMRILKKHDDVFVCGTTLDLVNLPLKTFPEAKSWLPADMNVYPDFYETYTGGHLLLFRGAEFADFMAWKDANHLQFVDGNMHKYCYEQAHKKWARTKETKAYHLTWDLYFDLDHPYTKMKTNISFKDTWHHNRTSDYTLTTY
jgi:Glycosyl transferase family 2